MSGTAAAVGPRQRYAAAIQQLQDVSSAPDVPAAIAVLKKVRRVPWALAWIGGSSSMGATAVHTV